MFRYEWLVGATSFVVLVALVAAGNAALVHHGCFDIATAGRPDRGTPRGQYCRAAVSLKPWVSFIVVPVIAAILIALATRPKLRLLGVFTVAACCVMVANAIAVNVLPYSLTI